MDLLSKRHSGLTRPSQIIFQHYRELVRPKQAKTWFSIEPGTDGKIVYLEGPADGHQKDGEQACPGPAKPEAAAV